jgi:molybdopterin synthase sulfur carrier subunit
MVEDKQRGGTMTVRVRIPPVLRKYTNQQAVVEAQPGTIADVIEDLDARYPGIREQLIGERGELHRFVNVYLNDEDVRYMEALNTKASDGDALSLLPSVAGGSVLPEGS